MQNGQRTYTKEFKVEAAKLAQTSGKSMGQVALDLGVFDSSLSRWPCCAVVLMRASCIILTEGANTQVKGTRRSCFLMGCA